MSATWVSFSFAGISGPALTFVTFLLAQLIYLARAGRDVAEALRFARSHVRDVAVLNALTLATWLFGFMALQRIEASVESAVYQGVSAVLGFLLTMLHARQRFSHGTVAGMSVATALLGLLVLVRIGSASSASPLQDTSVGAGLALAFVAGATGGCYMYYSSVLHRRAHISATTVLCVRFALLLIVTGGLGASEVIELSRADPGVIARLVALSIAYVVVPTFLLQYAISRLPPVRISAMAELVPLIALGSEYAVRPWGSVAAPLTVVLASIALIVTNRKLSHDLQAPGRPIEREPV